MKATLGLEAIGGFHYRSKKTGNEMIDATFDFGPDPCWVAKITGFRGTDYFQREHLHGKKDYTNSNSKGTRGIFVWYTLETGKYYEVESRLSWSRSEHYFCKTDDNGDIIKVERKEVEAWCSREAWRIFKEKQDGQRQKAHDGD
jgi:hypothetical protein